MKVSFAYTEAAIVVVFCCVFLISGLGSPWAHTIRHDFPYGYGASDAFFHQSVTEYMKEQGRVKYTPPYEVGGYDKVLDAHPPMLFQLTGIFSTFTGSAAYDSIYFITVIAYLLAILVLYLIIRQYSKNIAIISLPFGLLILSNKFSISLHWGYWLLIMGILFMIFSLWALTRIRLKHYYIILALDLGSLLIAHQPEGVFIIVFIMLYLGADALFNRRIDKTSLKSVVFGLLIALVLAAYSLNIFYNTFMQTEGYRGKFDTEFGANSIFIKELGIPLVLIALLGLSFFV